MKNKSFSMNKKLCSLIALLLSDGSVYYDKSKRTYCVQFTSNTKSMREYFKSLITDLFDITNFSENKCKNAVSIRFFSKKIAEVLFQFSPTYRTLRYSNGKYPNCKVPDEIKISPKFSAEFLKAFASCDGSISINRRNSTRVIEITCYHHRLKNDLFSCLQTLGIECRICKHSLKISNKTNIKKFADYVGFLKDSLVSDTTSNFFGEPKLKKLSEALW